MIWCVVIGAVTLVGLLLGLCALLDKIYILESKVDLNTEWRKTDRVCWDTQIIINEKVAKALDNREDDGK